MKLDRAQSILIIGLGLIGGSYAKALSQKGYRVFAIDRCPESIEYALAEKMIVEGSTDTSSSLIERADLIVFALYPKIFIEWIEENAHRLRPGCVLTDVTGVKSIVVDRVQSMLPDGVEFIAAHPMAGREVSGVKNSDPTIFRGANYVVTPSEKNTPAAIELCKALGEELGFSRVSVLSVEDHDSVIAFVSQLTHCIAICLMTCNHDERLQDYTGDSFRDLTRIARLNDEMWSELFLSNRDSLLEQMTMFENELKELRAMLVSGDREALRAMMRASTARRALFDKKI